MNKPLFYIGFFVIVCLFSSCEKCIPNILCPYQNPQFYSIQSGDTAALYFPNAFTPNGDGVNDLFLLIGNNNIASIGYKIYDASGRQIFEVNANQTISHQNGYVFSSEWDGTEKGRPCDVGIYAVRVNATTVLGNSFQLLGTVSLIDGLFLGDNRASNGNMYLEMKNSQFPAQNNNGVFDPYLPNGEHLQNVQVNNCH